MKRKSPVHHTVKRHKRRGKWIDSFERGKGQDSQGSRRKVVGTRSLNSRLPKQKLIWISHDIMLGFERYGHIPSHAYVYGSQVRPIKHPTETSDVDILVLIPHIYDQDYDYGAVRRARDRIQAEATRKFGIEIHIGVIGTEEEVGPHVRGYEPFRIAAIGQNQDI